MSKVVLAELYRPRHIREMVGNKLARYLFVLRLAGTLALRRHGKSGREALRFAKEKFKQIFGVSVDDVLKNTRSKYVKQEVPKVLKMIEEETLPAAALLVGPPGVGKTTLVYAAANDFDLRVFELNASDFRTSKTINRYVYSALTTPQVDPLTLTVKDHMVFLDEVDGLSAIGDSGGAAALYRILKEDMEKKFIRYPLVLAANDRYASSVRMIKNLVLRIEFRRPSVDDVVSVLKRIYSIEARKRGLKKTADEVEDILRKIARASNGDFRSAIEDLQIFLETGEPHISRKNREFHIAEIMRTIISDRVKTLDDLRRELMNYDDDPGLLLYRSMENIPAFVRPQDLPKAFRMLSDADLTLSRARRGNRSLLRYVALLATAPFVFYVREKPRRNPRYLRHIKVKRPEYILKLSKTRERRQAMRETFLKASNKLHLSTKKFVEDVLPYLRVIALYQPRVLLDLGFDKDMILDLVPEKDRTRVAQLLAEYELKKEEEKKKKAQKKQAAQAKSKKETKKAKKEAKKEEKKDKSPLEDFLGDLF